MNQKNVYEWAGKFKGWATVIDYLDSHQLQEVDSSFGATENN
jgi:hypothetical protein